MLPIHFTLVRHAQVDAAWKPLCYGQSDVPLSDEGVARTRDLAHELSGRRFDAIYSSDLSRALQLAEALHRVTSRPLRVDQRLRERNFGTWEGRLWDAIWLERGEAIHDMVARPDTFRPGEGETTFEMRGRIVDVVNHFFDPSNADLAPRNICVVTHGGPIAALLGTLARRPVSDWYGLQPKQGTFVEVTVSAPIKSD